MFITSYLAIIDLGKFFESTLMCFGVILIIAIFITMLTFRSWNSTLSLPFQSVAEFRQKLISESLVGEGDFLGCTEAEIQQIMESQNVHELPLYYREFLRVSGKGSGALRIWTIFYYPDILDITMKVDKRLLSQVPEKAFIFVYKEYKRSTQESQSDEIIVDKFLGYFPLDNRDNPPVFYIDNLDLEPQRTYPTLLHFLADLYYFEKEIQQGS